MMIGRVMYFGQSRIEIPAGVSEIGIAKITRGLFGAGERQCQKLCPAGQAADAVGFAGPGAGD